MAEPTLIGSVQRALRLLEAVAASEKAASAKSLARMLGLPLPTTYHLLRTLVFEGYLRKADDGYLLGSSPFDAQDSTVQPQLPRVRPVLRSLRDQLEGATYLSLYKNGEIRLLDIAESPGAPCVDLWVGTHDSGHATAFGKAILAGLDEEQRNDYISRHELHDLTPNTITTRNALERSLATTADVWMDQEEYLLGTTCLAMPIRAGDVVGAVAVSLPDHSAITEEKKLVLRRAARRLSLAMSSGSIII